MFGYALSPLSTVPLLASATIDLREGADVTTYPSLQTTPEYLATEERILERLDQTVPANQELRVLLLGPGSSTTDPLYARRFLDGWQARRGQPASMDIFDIDAHPQIEPYLSGIDWGHHVVRIFIGRLGNIFDAPPSRTHLMITLHPYFIFQRIEELALRHLVSGGILLWQEDYAESLAAIYDSYITMLQEYLDTNFTRLQPIHIGPMMDTTFSRRFRKNHTLVLENKLQDEGTESYSTTHFIPSPKTPPPTRRG